MHHRTIALSGINLPVAYIDLPGSSDLPPRVFLHGLGSSSMVTFPEHAVQSLQQPPRAILIDLPGFGSSRNAPATWTYAIEDQADLAAAFLTDLGIEPATIIGHSMGGSIAIALAYRHAERVDSLIAIEPNLDPGIGTLSAHIARQSEEGFVARGHGMLLRAISQQATRGDRGSSIYLPSLQQALPVALHRAAVSLLANRTPTFREQLAVVAQALPTTYLYGTRTPDISGLTDLEEHGVAVVAIPDAGHVLMDDNPDAFVAAMLAAENRAISRGVANNNT